MKAVGDDIEKLAFNRGVARLYELVNTVAAPLQAVAAGKADDELKAALREATEMLVMMLAPMMPHLAEQCLAALGGRIGGKETLVARSAWPVFDPALVVENEIVLPVQINGKKRGDLTIARDADQASIQQAVLALDFVKAALNGARRRRLSWCRKGSSMSLPDRFFSAIKAFRVAFFALGAAVLMAGCTVQPLYSSGAGAGGTIGGSVAPDMRAKLASVSIDPANSIYGQQVRNRLIFLLGGGAGEPANPGYRLSLGLSRSVISAVSVDIGDNTDRTGRPSAGIVKATSNFVLRDKDGKPLATGTRTAGASFDRPRQEFANLRAQRDATKRAAEELAEQVFLALAQKMSKL